MASSWQHIPGHRKKSSSSLSPTFELAGFLSHPVLVVGVLPLDVGGEGPGQAGGRAAAVGIDLQCIDINFEPR